jgi:xanthine/uracil permease
MTLIGRAFGKPPEAERVPPPEIFYALTQTPPAPLLIGAGIQHALVALMYAVYAVLAARGAGLDPVAAAGFVSLSIVAMGAVTILQAAPTHLGAGRLLTQIPSPLSMVVFILVAQTHGLAAAGGGYLIAAVVVLALARLLPHLRAIFPPEIAGVVVILLGAELAVRGSGRFLGLSPETGVAPLAMLIATGTLASIVVLSVWGNRVLRVYAVLGGMAVGLTLALGLSDFAGNAAAALVSQPAVALPGTGYAIPRPEFILEAALPLTIVAVLTVLNDFGSMTTIDRMDNARWRRADMRMVGRGMTAHGLGLVFSGMTATLSPVASSANIGLAFASGVTSRTVGLVAGGMLVAAAFLPGLASMLVVVPEPIIGAMMVYTASFLVVKGAELVLSRMLNARRTFVVGLGVASGIAVIVHTDIAATAPASLEWLLQSGLTFGSIVAILLNLLFRIGIRQSRSVQLSDADPAGTAARFLEEAGRDWGARREVFSRAALSVGEACEALAAAGLNPRSGVLTADFDEFKLSLLLSHDGPPLLLGQDQELEKPEDLDALLDGDDDAAIDRFTTRMSQVLLNRLADRVRSCPAGQGRSQLTFLFDH